MRKDNAARILDIPEDFGEVISEAVQSVAKGPQEYDLWYHDAPVWLLHREHRKKSYTRVSRVQITPCLQKNQRVLVVQPDVHMISRLFHAPDYRHENVVRSLKKSVSAAYAETTSLDMLYQQCRTGDRTQATDTIVAMIKKVWEAAESFREIDLEEEDPKHHWLFAEKSVPEEAQGSSRDMD